MISEKDVEYLSPRVSVVRKDDRLSVIIRAASDPRKNRLMLIWLLLFTVAGLGFIASYFIYPLTQSEKVMYAVTIAFWLYFEYVIAKAWRWRRYGFEQLNIKDGKLLMKRDVKGRGFVFTYALRDISKFDHCDDNTPGWMKIFGGYWDISGESLLFKIDEQEVRFGSQLSVPESNSLLRVLRPYVRAEKREDQDKEKKEKQAQQQKKKKK